MNDDGMVAIAGVLAVLLAGVAICFLAFAVMFVLNLAGYPIH